MNYRSFGFCARFAIPMTLAAVTAACGSVVNGDEEDDQPLPGCGLTDSSEGAASWLEPTEVKSAAFIGGRLHLQTDFSGDERYLVVALESPTRARVVATPDALRGPASFAEVRSGFWARVRVDADGDGHAEVMDASVADAPEVVARVDIDGLIDRPDAFSISDDRLFFCARDTETAPSTFVEVDLRDPRAPAPPASVNASCDQYGAATFATEGPTWFVYNHPTGNYVQEVSGYHVGSEGVKGTVQYGYNQTGVHAYGNVLRADTSAARAVADPENDSLFLIANTESPSSTAFAWATLSVSSSRELLGVVDKTVYLATPEGVRAYDITDLDAPLLTPYQAEIAFTERAPRLLAASKQLLLIADGAATLYLAPRDDPGALAPLRIYDTAGAAPPPTCP